MNVLSLFDGNSGAMIALERAGIKVDNYFASEIDKYAIKVSKANYPNIIQLGNINLWRLWDFPKIDLVIGGSPCQGFSLAGKQLAFDDPRSKLFFEYVAILRNIKCFNPQVKFLLENVKMKQTNLDIITDFLGVKPIFINSNLVSAQNRKRYYWCNWDNTVPVDKEIFLRDIIEPEVDESFYHTANANKYMQSKNAKWMPDGKTRAERHTLKDTDDKSHTITASISKGVPHNYLQCGAIRGRYLEDGSTAQKLELRTDNKTNALTTVQKDNVIACKYNRNDGLGEELDKAYPLNATDWRGLNRNQNQNAVKSGIRYRKLTPVECERLQTLPDNYTNHTSNTQRYKMLGNGFTIDVIAHLLRGM